MSHFTVMVVTDDNKEETIAKALQPFHEFECTGTNDEFVKDVDITEERREEYNNDTVNKIKMSDGTLEYPYDEKFYRPATQSEIDRIDSDDKKDLRYSKTSNSEGGYDYKILEYPSDSEKVEVKRSETQTFEEFIDEYYDAKLVPHGEEPDTEGEHQFGYALLNEDGTIKTIIDRTNPDYKWDWWTVGGRWSGMLKVKDKNDSQKGTPGVMGTEYDSEGFDQCRVGNLDFDGMLQDTIDNIKKRRMRAFEEAVHKCMEDEVPEGADFMLLEGAFEKWDQLSVDSKEARESLDKEWDEAPEDKGSYRDFLRKREKEGCKLSKTLKLSYDLGYGFMGIDAGQTMQEAIDSAEPFSTFAVLMDNTWYERGEMGWWACVSDEDDNWGDRFKELLNGLDKNKYITIVDCHI